MRKLLADLGKRQKKRLQKNSIAHELEILRQAQRSVQIDNSIHDESGESRSNFIQLALCSQPIKT